MWVDKHRRVRVFIGNLVLLLFLFNFFSFFFSCQYFPPTLVYIFLLLLVTQGRAWCNSTIDATNWARLVVVFYFLHLNAVSLFFVWARIFCRYPPPKEKKRMNIRRVYASWKILSQPCLDSSAREFGYFGHCRNLLSYGMFFSYPG